MPSETMLIDGLAIKIEPVKPLSGGGQRLDIIVEDDGRTWRVDVSATGGELELVTSWQDDQLADLDQPEWLNDVVARLARAA